MNELKTRGAAGIPLAAVDGLSGFPDAIAAALPKTEVQLRMARPVRDSARFVPYKDRKAVTAGLRKTRLSPPTESAAALGEFAEARGAKHPMISKIRKAVYTTDAIESVNCTIQKIIKRRQSFPNDEAAMRLIFMGLKNISRKWTMPIRDWGAALNQFAIIYGEDRVPL
jgi:transposase-like protein